MPQAGQYPKIFLMRHKSGRLMCPGFKKNNISIAIPNTAVIPSGLLKDMNGNIKLLNLCLIKRFAI